MYSQLLLHIEKVIRSLQGIIDIASNVPVACSIIHFVVSISVSYLSFKVFIVIGSNHDMQSILEYTDKLDSIRNIRNNTGKYLSSYLLLTAILVTSIVSLSNKGLNLELVIILSVISGYITHDKLSSFLYERISKSALDEISKGIYAIKKGKDEEFIELITKLSSKDKEA